MSFLYFAPGNRHELPEHKRAIPHAFDSVGGPACEVHPGPNGGPGIIFGDNLAWGTRAQRVGYYADEQTWQEIPGTGLWIGWYEMPTPSELQRAKMLPGHQVELGDGNRWTVPIARHFVALENDFTFVCGLPSAATWDGEHWITDGPIQKYQHLWKIALRWMEDLSPTADGHGTVEDDCNGCVTMLGTNYRVGPVECSILGLLTADSRGQIVSATLDIPTFLDWSKKNGVSVG